MADKEEDSFDCPVCREIVVEPMVGSCGHTICKLCKMGLPRPQCPECRRVTKFRPNFMLGRFIQKRYPEAYIRKQKELFKFTEEGKFEEACKAFRVVNFKQSSHCKADKIYLLECFKQYYDRSNGQAFPDGFARTVTIIQSPKQFYWRLSTEMKGFSYVRLNDDEWLVFSRGRKLPRQSQPIILE